MHKTGTKRRVMGCGDSQENSSTTPKSVITKSAASDSGAPPDTDGVRNTCEGENSRTHPASMWRLLIMVMIRALTSVKWKAIPSLDIARIAMLCTRTQRFGTRAARRLSSRAGQAQFLCTKPRGPLSSQSTPSVNDVPNTTISTASEALGDDAAHRASLSAKRQIRAISPRSHVRSARAISPL